jgi:membrane protein DedA with SNARE-associated domain
MATVPAPDRTATPPMPDPDDADERSPVTDAPADATAPTDPDACELAPPRGSDRSDGSDRASTGSGATDLDASTPAGLDSAAGSSPTSSAGDTEPAPGAARPLRRSTLPLIVVPLVGLVVAGRVGDALAPTLVTENPALMILLNSTNRYLVLTTNQLDAAVYYSIGLFRLLLPDPLFYLLGYLYGDEAIRWMERRMPTVGSGIRKLEGWFDRAKYPLVFIMPNNPVCLLAGAAGMPVVPFMVVNVAGTVGRLWLMRVAGEVFEEWVDKLLELISTYRPWLLALSIGWVVIAVWSEWRKGRGQIEGLLELEEDLEEGTDHATGADPDGER